MSSASIFSAGQCAGASLTNSSHQMSRPGSMAISWPVRLSTITVLTSGHSRRASSTFFLSGTMLPRRQPPSAVMSTVDSASWIALLDRVGAKPPKITLCGAPMRVQASMAMAVSGTIGM